MRILGPAREQVCGPEHVRRSIPDRLVSLGSDTYARTKGPVRILGPAREQVCGPEHVRRSIPDRLVSLGSDTYARTKGPVRILGPARDTYAAKGPPRMYQKGQTHAQWNKCAARNT